MQQQVMAEPPFRQIRAVWTHATVTVYQAYSPAIATAAVRAGRFVPPFRRGRMTWIKPSFLWMAYRCGWATKPGQERVLAVEITRSGFEWALAHSCLSHYEAAIYKDHSEWLARKAGAQVRIQWDPERDLLHRPMTYRSIQVGLGGDAVDRYVDEWTVGITDVTDLFRRVHDHVVDRQLERATAPRPERAPPVPAAERERYARR